MSIEGWRKSIGKWKARTEGKTSSDNGVLDMPGAGIRGPSSFFDPWGLSTDISEGRLLFYREVELKHGRVCMLASLGILVAEKYHPVFGNFDGASVDAFKFVPFNLFWLIIVLLIGYPEHISLARDLEGGERAGEWNLKAGRTPGDFGFDPLNLKAGFERNGQFKELQGNEVSTGRLAMIGTAGMLAQELVNGKKIF